MTKDMKTMYFLFLLLWCGCWNDCWRRNRCRSID